LRGPEVAIRSCHKAEQLGAVVFDDVRGDVRTVVFHGSRCHGEVKIEGEAKLADLAQQSIEPRWSALAAGGEPHTRSFRHKRSGSSP
jgi:hypothetical protein